MTINDTSVKTLRLDYTTVFSKNKLTIFCMFYCYKKCDPMDATPISTQEHIVINIPNTCLCEFKKQIKPHNVMYRHRRQIYNN